MADLVSKWKFAIFLAILAGCLAVAGVCLSFTMPQLPLVVHAMVMGGLVYILIKKVFTNPDLTIFRTPWFFPSLAFILIYGCGFGRLLWIDEDHAMQAWIGVLVAVLTVTLVAFGLEKGDASLPEEQPPRYSPGVFNWFMALWFMVAFGMAAVHVWKLGGFPLLSASESSRIAMDASVGAVWRLGGYSLVVWSWFAVGDYKTVKALPKALTWGGVLTTAVLIVLLGYRAPLVYLAGGVFIIWTTFGPTIERSPRAFYKAVIIGCVVVIGLWLAAGKVAVNRLAADPTVKNYPEVATYLEEDREAELLLKQVPSYVATTAENFLRVVDAVPLKYDHRYGASYIDPLLTILPGKQYTLDMQLKQALGMTFKGGGFVPTLLGEAWVNFGPLGFVLIPGLLFSGLIGLYRWHGRSGNLAVKILYVFFLVHVSANMHSGLAASSVFPYLVCFHGLLGAIVLKGR